MLGGIERICLTRLCPVVGTGGLVECKGCWAVVGEVGLSRELRVAAWGRGWVGCGGVLGGEGGRGSGLGAWVVGRWRGQEMGGLGGGKSASAGGDVGGASSADAVAAAAWEVGRRVRRMIGVA